MGNTMLNWIKKTVKCASNLAYNTAVAVPLSVLKGASVFHFMPSKGNTDRLLVNFADGVEETDMGYLVNIRHNEEKAKLLGINDHPYHRFFEAGKMRGDSMLEQGVPFALSIAGAAAGYFGTIGLYVCAVQQYGWKALAPLAVTNALSLAHEIKFTREVKAKARSLEALLDLKSYS
jgi:hypothetical protein